MGSHPHFLFSDLFRKVSDRQANLASLLGENILFSTLTRSELLYLTNLVYERHYRPQESVFHQNDRGLGMYLIAKGRVSISSSKTEEDVFVTELGEGSFFGEMALVDPDNLRTATVIAKEQCILVGFFKPDLMELLERRPEIGVKILFQLSRVLSQRLLSTTQRLSELDHKIKDSSGASS